MCCSEVAAAFLVVFQSVTLEGWSDIMAFVQEKLQELRIISSLRRVVLQCMGFRDLRDCRALKPCIAEPVGKDAQSTVVGFVYFLLLIVFGPGPKSPPKSEN